MSQLPRVPPEDEGHADLSSHEPEVNPYAPAVSEIEEELEQGSIDLPMQYWAALAGIFAMFAMLTYFAPGLGTPTIVALVAAAIRVPLLQRRLSRSKAFASLPKPLLLLLTSWALMLACGLASVIAFCVVCIPSGLMVFSYNTNGVEVPILFGVSGLIGLVVFVALFIYSLKLSV